MLSENLIKRALDKLGCSQKALAIQLGVSPTQITKWKKGDHMSSEMEKKVREIIGSNTFDEAFILLAGSVENAEKWEGLIHFLANSALQNAETGIETYPLLDEMNDLCHQTLDVLNQIGIKIPKDFPHELDADYADIDDEDLEEPLWDAINANPITLLIYEMYNALNGVYGFYSAYIEDFMYDDELDLFDTVSELEYSLLALSACKIRINNDLSPDILCFRYKVNTNCIRLLDKIKNKVLRARIPLKAELLDLVNSSSDTLSVEAEEESFGTNALRLHPDIYMNELLVGMRTIHQVLPVILKKLGMEEDFELDTADFHISRDEN